MTDQTDPMTVLNAESKEGLRARTTEASALDIKRPTPSQLVLRAAPRDRSDSMIDRV
jgi:hypothetical protein